MRFGWVFVAGFVLMGVMSKLGANSAKTTMQTPAGQSAAVAPAATDTMGIPVAPFSLSEPPAPNLESTSEQDQLSSLYQNVLRSARGGEKYNLACAYSVAGDVEAAIYWLQRAAREDGVDHGWATRDTDLSAVRDDKRGPELLSYLSRMAEYYENHPLDRQILSLPENYRIGQPIPMLIGLHGFGSVPEDFGDDFREMANSLGMALLAVSATQTRGPRSYVWREDVEADTKRIERAIAADSDKVTIAGGQIYLIGFSQGAQLALEIAAKHPESFGGAIAMSPGTISPMQRIGFGSSMLSGRRFVIVAGEGESGGTLAAAENSRDRLLSFGAKVHYKIYPNVKTHAFPSDYFEMLPKWLAFLVGGKSPDVNEQ